MSSSHPMMKLHRWIPLVTLGFQCGLALSSFAAPAAPERALLPNAPFVMDNGLTDTMHQTLEAKASLLQELGYDGVGWRPGQIPEMRRELERRNLRMFS